MQHQQGLDGRHHRATLVRPWYALAVEFTTFRVIILLKIIYSETKPAERPLHLEKTLVSNTSQHEQPHCLRSANGPMKTDADEGATLSQTSDSVTCYPSLPLHSPSQTSLSCWDQQLSHPAVGSSGYHVSVYYTVHVLETDQGNLK